MTTAVNALQFRNLSLVCRNGTEAVGRITESPYITSSSISSKKRPFGVRRRVTACKPQHIEEPCLAKSSFETRKRSRKGGVVRFAAQVIQESEHQLERPRAKKRRRFEATDSEKWYTRGELKDIQKSCIITVQTCQDQDGSLNRFQPQNQAKRKMARSQAYEALRAIQSFEKATGTKAPPELLSMLLQRYSMSRVIEANTSALRTANDCSRVWERYTATTTNITIEYVQILLSNEF